MNILYYFAEKDRYMDQWQRVHIFDELESHGYKMEVFNPLHFSSLEQANEQLILHLKKNAFDLFITCMRSEFLYTDTIEQIKSMGVPTVLICFDNLHAPFMHKRIAPLFDLVWLTSIETEPIFKRWGCKTVFQPYAANPNLFIPKHTSTKHCVSFIGTPYGSRTDKINLLTRAGISFVLYSNRLSDESNTNKKESIPITQLLQEASRSLRFSIGRRMLYAALLKRTIHREDSELFQPSNFYIYPSVPFKQFVDIYGNSSLSLNITELRNTYVLRRPVHKLHLRTFEIPMAGGLQLVSYYEELANYFTDGSEIVFYKSPEEFVSKARFYTDPKNDSITLQMKLRARERAVNEHSWMKRFTKIIEQVGL